MIFQNPKKFSKYHFSFKSYSNMRCLWISGHLLTKCMGKTDIEFTVELCERF